MKFKRGSKTKASPLLFPIFKKETEDEVTKRNKSRSPILIFQDNNQEAGPGPAIQASSSQNKAQENTNKDGTYDLLIDNPPVN
ncbi:hypothetical protein F8M41_010784 [Gigaspora margarita]|uniref:Uncharacterized protein n=1 Tax=Gigaspora margarita TaxID=4874 RepID=A0A8H3X072_GIGMA|nr:hypothetical protein F8M41_010784 [Gigaspora margarita]